jgi:hypothetical protein
MSVATGSADMASNYGAVQCQLELRCCSCISAQQHIETNMAMIAERSSHNSQGAPAGEEEEAVVARQPLASC